MAACSPSLRIKRSIQRVNRLTAIYPELADTFNLVMKKEVIVKPVHVTHTFTPHYEITMPDSLPYHFEIDTLKTPYLALKDTSFSSDIPIKFYVNDSLYENLIDVDLEIKSGNIILKADMWNLRVKYPESKTVYKYTLKLPFWKDKWFWFFSVVMIVLILVAVMLLVWKL